MGDLLGLAVYNPAILSDQAFLDSFVARGSLADRLLQRLGEIGPEGLATHHLILGQRGMGKTSLLRRLALGVRDDPALNVVLLPLGFREEQYNVHNLRVLWLNCLDALGDWFEQTGQPEQAATVDRDVTRLSQAATDREGSEALDCLLAWAKREGRRPLLLLDNIDIVFDGLRDQQWGLRRVLQKAGGIVVVGASAGWLEATTDREAAFYDFFQVTVLEPLGADELMTCLRRLAASRGEHGRAVQRLLVADPGRIRALHDLTGGNPRTLTLLYLLLEMDADGDVLSDLERLLDQVSVLYKARIEDLAPQARVVLDAVALAWDPVIAAEVATTAGLPTTTVSTQLERLQRDGIVQKVSIARSKRAAFQLGERFFNIWYLMRHGPRRQRARLRWLSAFLRGLYTPVQLRSRARDLLSSVDQAGPGHGQYCLALGDALDDPAWQRLLAAEAERAITDYLARSGKRLGDIGELSDLPRPESGEDWDLHGQLLHRHLGRVAEAEAAYRRAVELEPELGWAWIHLGNLLRDRGHQEGAYAAYQRAIEAGAGLWGWPDVIELVLHTGRFDDFERAYRNAIDANPEDARTWGVLGFLLATDPSRWAEAEAAFREAIARDPVTTSYKRGLGSILERQNRLVEAEAVIQDALRQDPSDYAGWRSLGYLLLYSLDRIDDGAAAYQEALKLEPDDLVSLSNLLAASLLRQGPELHDDQTFNAVACRHPEHGANLLRALRAIVQDNLGDAVDSFAVALSDDSSEVFTLYQGFVLLFLRETARRGFGDRLLATLTERGIADRHWPLQVAYDAYLHGENRLMDVNPEVRIAARRIYDWLEAPNRSDARLI